MYTSPYLDIDNIYIASIEIIDIKKFKSQEYTYIKQNDEWIEKPNIILKIFSRQSEAEEWIEKTEQSLKKRNPNMYSNKYTNIRSVSDFINDIFKCYQYAIAIRYVNKMLKQVDNYFYKKDKIWMN